MESPSLVMQAPSYTVQPRIPSSVFEGLFVRGLEPDSQLARALEQEGYDRRCPEVDYPMQEGFTQTLVGRVAAVAIPLVGPARVVERLPRYLAMMGRPDLEVRMVPLGERSHSVYIPDVHNRPEFIAGAMEVALELAHVQPIILVEEQSPTGFRLLIRW
jgi:uncharacterized protein (TIGR02265 family)